VGLVDLSKFIPKQVHVPYLGALYDLTGKVFFAVNAVSFLMLTRNTYYSQNDTLLRDIFGSYALFMLTVIGAGIVLLYMAYVFLIPSLNSYTQQQAIIEGRSPMYEKICEINERLIKLEEKR
jgi:hypothetical protein